MSRLRYPESRDVQSGGIFDVLETGKPTSKMSELVWVN